MVWSLYCTAQSIFLFAASPVFFNQWWVSAGEAKLPEKSAYATLMLPKFFWNHSLPAAFSPTFLLCGYGCGRKIVFSSVWRDAVGKSEVLCRAEAERYIFKPYFWCSFHHHLQKNPEQTYYHSIKPFLSLKVSFAWSPKCLHSHMTQQNTFFDSGPKSLKVGSLCQARSEDMRWPNPN